jgi:alkanesulfonate monooxygenase
MWSGEGGAFAGKHYQLAELLCDPLPIARPHPPILIGGGGEKKTLKLVARYADACNLFAMPGPDGDWESGLDLLRHKLDVLRGHCEAEGRPYDAIEKTTIGFSVAREANPMAVTPEVAVDLLGRLAELGIDHHIIGVADAATVDLIAADVLPHVASRTGTLVPA